MSSIVRPQRIAQKEGEPLNHYTIQLMLKDGLPDNAGQSLERDTKRYTGIRTGKVRTSRTFTIITEREEKAIREFAEHALKDPVIHDLYMGKLFTGGSFQRYLYLAKLPGVTDDEGVSTQKTFSDYFHQNTGNEEQFIFTGELYYFEHPLEDNELETLGRELLGNPLINHIEYGPLKSHIDYIPTVKIKSHIRIRKIPVDLSDKELTALSREMLLSLDPEEMRIIRDHYGSAKTQKKRDLHGMSADPTDCELEIIGQTWSEHCKHKEFNALINYKDLDTGEEKQIDSLFKNVYFPFNHDHP
ncbi:MAG: hypothetical protein U5N56_10015 [Candidatus Marinimicrobia bacterium]|nr:hypothetical protein [Candidatus Neomarinimicrobiota bacterium]